VDQATSDTFTALNDAGGTGGVALWARPIDNPMADHVTGLLETLGLDTAVGRLAIVDVEGILADDRCERWHDLIAAHPHVSADPADLFAVIATAGDSF
jgi:hypothetical protein